VLEPDVVAPEAAAAPPTGPLSPGAVLARVQERWEAIIAVVARQDRNTAALLKDCRPTAADGQSVTLGFFYEFHCKRVSESRRIAVVAEAVSGALGSPRQIICTVVEASAREQATRPRTLSDQARQDPVVRHAVEELGARIAGVKSEPDAE
jgi:hypothetical protein